MTDITLDDTLLAYRRGILLGPQASAALFTSDLVTMSGVLTPAGKDALIRALEREQVVGRSHVLALIDAGGALIKHVSGHADDKRLWTGTARQVREFFRLTK